MQELHCSVWFAKTKSILVMVMLLCSQYTTASKKLFVFLGQSNMAGRAPIEVTDFDAIPNVFLLNIEGEFVEARNPLNIFSSIKKETYMQRLGPAYSFAQAMSRAYPNDSILLVVNARGGTALDLFMKGDDSGYYESTLLRIRKAIQKESGTSLEAIIWHQGESNRESYKDYLSTLNILIDDYRADLGEPDLPLIAGQLGLWNPDYQKIREQIRLVEQVIPNSHLVSSKGLTNFDRHHFDNQSQKKLGLRYARKYLEIKGETISMILRASRASSFKGLSEMIHYPTKDYVMVAAHRGDWRNAPENSLLAIQEAIEMGVDIVEVDIGMTADSVLVLMHDNTLDRSTTCVGEIRSFTYDSLMNHCLLRDGLSDETPYPIPTLEQALELIKGRVIINLDKAENFVPLTYSLLKKTNTVDHAIFSSYYPYEKLKRLSGDYLDSIFYMPKVKHSTKKPNAYVDLFLKNTESLILQTRALTEQDTLLQIIPYAKDKDLLIWINTLEDFHSAGHTDEKAMQDPDAHWGWVIDQGANIIQTDRPQLLIDYLKTKELHD